MLEGNNMYNYMNENEYRTFISSNKIRKNYQGGLVTIKQQKAILANNQNKQTYSNLKSKIYHRPKTRTLKIHK